MLFFYKGYYKNDILPRIKVQISDITHVEEARKRATPRPLYPEYDFET